MKTKFIAVFAVLAMVFVGAAVIAQDNASDASAFADDSPIDGFGSGDGIKVIHYGDDNGTMKIVMANSIPYNMKVTLTKEANSVVFDPLPGGDQILIKVGSIDTYKDYTVTVYEHGSDTASATCVLKKIATTNVTFTSDATATTSAENPSKMARNNAATESVFTLTNGTEVQAGWSADGTTTNMVATSATLEEILLNATWNATTPAASIKAVWSDGNFNVAFNWNKPVTDGMIGGGPADAAVPTALSLDPKAITYLTNDQMSNASLKGYTFDGWFTKANGGVKVTLDSDTNKKSIQEAFLADSLTAKVGQTMTLYAQWTPITYTINFNIEAGYTISDPTEGYNVQADIKYDQAINLKTVAQIAAAAGEGKATAKAGYTFQKWTDGDYTDGALVKNLSFTAGATVSLTGVFSTVNVTVNNNTTGTVTFDTNYIANWSTILENGKSGLLIITNNSEKMAKYTVTSTNGTVMQLNANTYKVTPDNYSTIMNIQIAGADSTVNKNIADFYIDKIVSGSTLANVHIKATTKDTFNVSGMTISGTCYTGTGSSRIFESLESNMLTIFGVESVDEGGVRTLTNAAVSTGYSEYVGQINSGSAKLYSVKATFNEVDTAYALTS